MAAGTKVQLRLGERVVAEVSFREDELRIGRMKENDLVINNLAVSRFHAVLRRVGDGFAVEDLGSENGTFVNGVQVKGTLALPVGAELTIGKHALSIRTDDESQLPAPRARKSDAWDAAQTYFAPDLAPRAMSPAPAAPPTLAAGPVAPAPADDETGEEALLEAEAVDETGLGALAHVEPAAQRAQQALDLPDPEGLFAFGEEELVPPPPLASAAPEPAFAREFDVAAPEAAAAPAPAQRTESGASTALFDFGATDDLGLSEPSLARVAAAKAAAPAPAPAASATLHAGLIVERSGKVDRVAAFRGAELIVGRGPTCDLVLATAGVSRRHARFVREGDSFRVLDLGSANGIRVNGERASERTLTVGDVVGIDDFTLTFVLDREPLDEAVRSAPAKPASAAPHVTVLHEHVTVLHDAPLATMVEQDLVTSDDDDEMFDGVFEGEKELESVAEATNLPIDAPLVVGDFVVEVVVDAERLPQPLRDALRASGASALRLPAELRVRPKP